MAETKGVCRAKRAEREWQSAIIFDLPADKGLELKTKQPSLGWVTDINGHPALPFSIAARLILPVHID